MNFDDDILIERFLKEELSSIEHEKFLERLKTDNEFRDRVQIEKQFFETMNEDSWSAISNLENKQELNDYTKLFNTKAVEDIKNTIAKVGNEYAIKPKTSKNKSWYFYTGIAAMLLILLAVYINVNQAPSLDNLYANYLDASELPSLVSRDDNKIIGQAETFYNNKEFEKALVAYNDIIKTTSSNSGALYLYKGVSEMQLNKFQDAENTFDTLINSDSLDAPKGYWYKVLLYLKMKDKDQAIVNSYFKTL